MIPARCRRSFLSIPQAALGYLVEDQRPEHGAGVMKPVVEVVDCIMIIGKSHIFQFIGVEAAA